MKKKKSDFEKLFEQWLKRAMDLGYVTRWRYEPETFLLFDKGEYGMRKITYTPDYVVYFTKSFFDHFPIVEKIIKRGYLYGDKWLYYIDIKSKYNGAGTSSNREFPYNQRLMWEKNKIFINKVVLDNKINIFNQTFVSAEMAYYKRDKSKIKKQFRDCKII